jgi:hypothetical protein
LWLDLVDSVLPVDCVKRGHPCRADEQ